VSHNTRVDMNFFAIAANPPDVCECCGSPYSPPVWCFYGLCDPCFVKFDEQKMQGRFGRLLSPPGSPKRSVRTTESATEWIKWQREAAN